MKQDERIHERNERNSPGFISREWIETRNAVLVLPVSVYSPGFISREWIETVATDDNEVSFGILPALLVGSGLKLRD